MKNVLFIVIFFLQSCIWLNQGELKEATINGFYFRWINTSLYSPNFDYIRDIHDKNLKQTILFCSGSKLEKSKLSLNYFNYHFFDSSVGESYCTTSYGASTITKNSDKQTAYQKIQNWRFLSDTALVIQPFARPINDSSLIGTDSAYFRVLRKGIMEKAGAQGESVPWFMLADAQDTLIMFPELSSSIATDF
jgi:hypothetical protein